METTRTIKHLPSGAKRYGEFVIKESRQSATVFKGDNHFSSWDIEEAIKSINQNSRVMWFISNGQEIEGGAIDGPQIN